jgi:hypothetical protein
MFGAERREHALTVAEACKLTVVWLPSPIVETRTDENRASRKQPLVNIQIPQTRASLAPRPSVLISIPGSS